MSLATALRTSFSVGKRDGVMIAANRIASGAGGVPAAPAR